MATSTGVTGVASTASFVPSLGHVAYLLLWVIGGYAFAVRTFTKRLVT